MSDGDDGGWKLSSNDWTQGGDVGGCRVSDGGGICDVMLGNLAAICCSDMSEHDAEMGYPDSLI